MANTREIARENEQKALGLIAHFGGATARQIAIWTYQKSNEHVAVNKAYLLLKRLENKKLILKRASGVDAEKSRILVNVYVLTEKGADFFNYNKSKKIAHDGYDLTFSCTAHIIDAAITYLTKKAKEGMCVIGPAAIRNGALPDKKLQYCQGVYVDPKKDNIEIIAIMYVAGSWDSTVDKALELRRHCSKVEFIGEEYNVEKLKKMIKERRNKRG